MSRAAAQQGQGQWNGLSGSRGGAFASRAGSRNQGRDYLLPRLSPVTVPQIPASIFVWQGSKGPEDSGGFQAHLSPRYAVQNVAPAAARPRMHEKAEGKFTSLANAEIYSPRSRCAFSKVEDVIRARRRVQGGDDGRSGGGGGVFGDDGRARSANLLRNDRRTGPQPPASSPRHVARRRLGTWLMQRVRAHGY